MLNNRSCFALGRGFFVFGTVALLALGVHSTPAVFGEENDLARAALHVSNALLSLQAPQSGGLGRAGEGSESYPLSEERSAKGFGNVWDQVASEFALSSVKELRLQTRRPFPPAVERLFENRKPGDEAQPWDRSLANDPTYVIVTPEADITAVIESLGEAHGPQDLRVILLDPDYYEQHVRCLRDWTWLVGRGRDTTVISFPWIRMPP